MSAMRALSALAARGSRISGVRLHALVALGCAFVAFICFAPALIDPAHRFIGAAGSDPIEKMWFLSWAPYALSHHQPLLYSSAINYPTGINMMWNNSTLLLGVVLAPVSALWGPVVAYNLGMYAAVVASAWSGYWAIGRLVPSRIGSIVGGLLYGFSPYMMGQSLGHLTLVVMVYPPIVLVLFHEIVVLQRHRWWFLGVMLGVATSGQLFISEEVLASTAIAAAVGTLTLAVLHRNQCSQARLAYALRAALASVAVAAVLCGWAVWFQFTGPDQVHQTLQAFGGFVTDPVGFIVPTANQFIAPSTLVAVAQHFRGNPSEWDAYLGLPLCGVVVWVVWTEWSAQLVRVLACTAVIITILSLGPYVVIRGHQFPIPLPWLVTEHIPVLKNLLPNRFMSEVYLLVGVLIAYITHHWPRTPAARRRAGIVALAAGLCFMPALFRPSTPLPASSRIPSEARDVLAGGGVVLPSPFATSEDPVAMLVQAESNFAFTIPGGYAYAPNLPPVAPASALARLDAAGSTQLRVATLASSAARAQALVLLREAGIQTIVVFAESDASEFRNFWTALLGEPPILYGSVAIWTEVGSITARA
ncbi:MAG TPA: hypothetical protein VI434_04315 [Candidatus Dormibacteraeota bacterium]